MNDGKSRLGSLDIRPAENGWVVFVNHGGFPPGNPHYDGCVRPHWVFTNEEDLAVAIRNLVHHGNIA